MGIWTETVSECMEYNDDGEGRDTLVYSTHPEFDTGVPESPDEVRRRLVSLKFQST